MVAHSLNRIPAFLRPPQGDRPLKAAMLLCAHLGHSANSGAFSEADTPAAQPTKSK
jgi:hypothetical protein